MHNVKLELIAKKRDNLSKNYTKKLRESKKIPAVLYGPNLKNNINIEIDYKDFEKVFHAANKSSIINLKLDNETYEVIIKDFLIHPITRNILHVDFFNIPQDKEFNVEIPINYVGTPVGVKEGGGLYIYLKSLKIITNKNNLPKSIDINISNLKINQYLIVRDLKEKGYKIINHEGDMLVQVK